MRFLFVFKSVEWIGIEYLSSALKKAGHRTDLAFEAGLEGTFHLNYKIGNHRRILTKIREFKPDIVLFSCTTNLFPWVKEVAAEIKKNFNLPILAGGIHPTVLPEKVISCPDIDMVCIGEGEEAIVELADRLRDGQAYLKTDNFWFKQGGQIIKNPVRPLIESLDNLPFPDKDLFYKHGCFIKRAYVVTGRGCPYNCPYCFNHKMQEIYKGKCKNYVRKRSIENVIEELKGYKERYKIASVHFYDDTFILDKDWIFRFSTQYKEKIGLPFYCLVRGNLVTKEIMLALKNAGCVCVGMGIESGDEFIRNNLLRRCMSDGQIIDAANIIKSLGIKLVTFNIFGLPGETPAQMLCTMKINLQIKPESLFTYIFYPFPGTDLMRLAREKGFLEEKSVKMISEGFGNYQSVSLLKHPYGYIAYNMKVILPLLNKIPQVFQRYFVEKWVFNKHSKIWLSFIKMISIPFYSCWESRERFKEQLRMLGAYHLKRH